MTELQIQDAIRLHLGRERDLVLFRNNVGQAEIHGRRVAFGVGGRGGADLIGCLRGRFVAAEIKSPNGRQSPEQKQFEQLVLSKGGIYVVLRSVEEAQAWLDMERAK